jgi:hypothetical protein
MGGWGLGINPYGLYSPYASLGYRYFRDTMSHGNLNQRIDCSYLSENSILSCQGPALGVQCEVVANFTGLGSQKFELFGIGNLWKADKNVAVASARYNLYPRLIDNSAWWNHTFAVNGNSINLNLFHSLAFTNKYFGFRVVDLSCYERFVQLFNAVPFTSYENITVVNVNGPSRNVSLFGEVFLNKPIKV